MFFFSKNKIMKDIRQLQQQEINYSKKVFLDNLKLQEMNSFFKKDQLMLMTIEPAKIVKILLKELLQLTKSKEKKIILKQLFEIIINF